MKQYITLKDLTNKKLAKNIIEKYNFIGSEVFADDILDRNNIDFYTSEKSKNYIKTLIKDFNIKRLHCSYWAYPTSFITKNNFKELIDRFNGLDNLKNYYMDLSSKAMFNRWISEYKGAKDNNLDAYIFHLIDYAPIDGLWKFTIAKEEIIQAMISMLQQFINLLIDENLLDDKSPIIEIENAGWGLEYGIQTIWDYKKLFNELYDPFDKVRISWDINHLLHALGKKENKTHFFLPIRDLSDEMKMIENSDNLLEEWLKINILDEKLKHKISCIQLSDCKLKEIEYFTNGQLNQPFLNDLLNKRTWEEKEEYGVNIVLTHYDSHLVLEEGDLNTKLIREIINNLDPNICILHELKNSTNLEKDINKQINRLCYKSKD